MDHLDKLLIHAAEIGKSWLYAVGMSFADIYPDGSIEDRMQILTLMQARGYEAEEALEGYGDAIKLKKLLA